MTSLLTNVAAMTALQTLQQTNKSMDDTQNRISTGYKVGTAADNAAYWSIATTMRSDNKAMSAVEDSLGLGSAKIDIAYTALNSAINVVDEIKAKLVAASEPGVDKLKIQSEISELQKQLRSISDAASFSGENWLSVESPVDGETMTKNVVGSFNRASDGTVSVGTISIDISNIALFDDAANVVAATGDGTGNVGMLDRRYDAAGAALADQAAAAGADFTISTLTLTATSTTAEIAGFITAVEDGLQKMTKAASDIGAAKSRVEMQQDFVSNLMDAITRGVSALVDADMTEESTKLKALQTQQQLGVQALSIANSSSQSIMQLFQN